jgi:hypothetical protein
MPPTAWPVSPGLSSLRWRCSRAVHVPEIPLLHPRAPRRRTACAATDFTTTTSRTPPPLCVPCALLGPGARDSAQCTPARITASRIPAPRHAKTVFVKARSSSKTKSVLTVRWTPIVPGTTTSMHVLGIVLPQSAARRFPTAYATEASRSNEDAMNENALVIRHRPAQAPSQKAPSPRPHPHHFHIPPHAHLHD